jgi:hypothetical protein
LVAGAPKLGASTAEIDTMLARCGFDPPAGNGDAAREG